MRSAMEVALETVRIELVLCLGELIPLSTTGVGADDDAVLDWQILLDPLDHVRLRVEVIDGDIEKALNLRRVKVHGDDVVAARDLDHVGDEFGRDWCARAVLLILTSCSTG